jgi:peptidyl-tRNA hydrolase, PTH1 family
LKLIAGLGNPGKKYQDTRHNSGFLIIDFIASEFKIPLKEGKGSWLEGEGIYEGESFYLLKPSTYMNNSGEAISDFIDEKNLELKDILIIVDDFQLPFGTIRVRERGSDGGHNGLSSISYHLISEDYPRMRVGIGSDEKLTKDEYVNFVLNNFTNIEKEIFKKLLPVFRDCVLSFIRYGVTETMNNFNRSFLPPETGKTNSSEKKNNS